MWTPQEKAQCVVWFNKRFAKCDKLTHKVFCLPVDAALTKNVISTGESSVCGLVHRDKVRCPSTSELLHIVWKGTTVPTNCSGLVYVICGNR
ncbi:hypothetical protein AVEN_69692-1 [Araneus ventricosus]|uniref:Uncharacterized protein n=1 Tax=Araneus ventricosus TaxID=182803 RepID=A0A4Y2T1H0_ARAVE|nr:hypothetical protein AVEN_69692-1 [Araneus ventricosus]